MTPHISSIFQLIENIDREVQGRSSQPPGDVEMLLGKFVSGDLSPDEKKGACDVLRNEPEWMNWMADRVKALRAVNQK